jgi:Holliday junction resolvase RusA-like endonuclease
MSDSLEFTVRGLPVPQGSGRSFVAGGKAVHVTTSSPLLAWRGAIAKDARDAVGGRPLLTGPVGLTLAFRPAVRPASHYLPANSRRPVRVLRPDAPVYHTGRPDADKLGRAAMDALTAVAFDDDCRVADLRITKRWPDDGEAPGVDVRVRPLEEAR